jgi:hypothetical protein
MFSNAKDINAGLVGVFDLLEQVVQSFGGAGHNSRNGVLPSRDETVDSDLHACRGLGRLAA